MLLTAWLRHHLFFQFSLTIALLIHYLVHLEKPSFSYFLNSLSHSKSSYSRTQYFLHILLYGEKRVSPNLLVNVYQLEEILDWSKFSFGFFQNTVWGNPNELFDQPNIMDRCKGIELKNSVIQIQAMDHPNWQRFILEAQRFK